MDTEPDRHDFTDGTLRAAVLAQGAELCSVQSGGQEYLWQAGPEWPRHAPVLFPIVGEVAENHIHVDGKTYPMGRHGFARDCRFTWQARDADGCTLLLRDSEATRAQYPFAFTLTLEYRIGGGRLHVTTTVGNPGDQVLPASVGHHPAFAWPLPGAEDKDAHTITFAEPEPERIRRLQDNLVRPQPFPTPIQGRVLQLDERLFLRDAVILDKLVSRSLRYAAPGAAGIDLAWEGYRQLGIWSKPGGAPFLCLEPWHGLASPMGFDGRFEDKPGLLMIPAGGQHRLVHSVGIG